MNEAADLPGREASSSPAEEERRRCADVLSLAGLPSAELLELRAEPVGQEDRLERGVVVAALVDAEDHATPRPGVGIEDIANVERNELVLAKRGSEREGDQQVIAKT